MMEVDKARDMGGHGFGNFVMATSFVGTFNSTEASMSLPFYVEN